MGLDLLMFQVQSSFWAWLQEHKDWCPCQPTHHITFHNSSSPKRWIYEPEGCLSNNVYIPLDLRSQLIQWIHSTPSSGHPGIFHTIALVRNSFLLSFFPQTSLVMLGAFLSAPRSRTPDYLLLDFYLDHSPPSMVSHIHGFHYWPATIPR